MNLRRTLLFVAAAVAFGAASARDLSASDEVVRASADGHAYQNGGIGKDEVAQMREHLQRYDLRLGFSEGRHNAFVADVRLRITDAAGRKVFALDHAGPLTDVNLPAGHYRVLAEFGGVARSSNVDVKAGTPASVFLHWSKDAS